MSVWYGSTLCLAFEGGLGTIRRVQQSLTVAYMESENMCRVIASRDRYSPRGKAPVFLVIHMCLMVKAHESVGRGAKPAVRPQKFANHKKHMIL